MKVILHVLREFLRFISNFFIEINFKTNFIVQKKHFFIMIPYIILYIFF